MFDKKKISFKTKTVFGYNFKNSIDQCFCATSKMLFSGKINHDGTIDPSQADAFKKSELWSYIYYLYYYNNADIEEFSAMKSKEEDKADAVAFYNVVHTVAKSFTSNISKSALPASPIDSLSLINFINKVVVVNGENLVNPIFDYLKVITERKVLDNFKGVKFIMGDKVQNAQVLRGQAAKNADIKVGIHKTI